MTIRLRGSPSSTSRLSVPRSPERLPAGRVFLPGRTHLEPRGIAMPVIGTHALLQTSEPDALRACLRDAFGWPNVDAHDGWLIFALPPAELGIHPADAPAHELSFMC